MKKRKRDKEKEYKKKRNERQRKRQQEKERLNERHEEKLCGKKNNHIFRERCREITTEQIKNEQSQ